MSKERETSRLVSNQTGVAVTISGDPVILGVGNTELVRVTGAGNIGVGTTNTFGLLHLYSDTNVPQLNVHSPTGGECQIRLTSNAGDYRRILFVDSSSTKYNFQIAQQEIDNTLSIGPSTATGGLTFSSITGLTINSSGNVGVNTNSISTTFDVNGTIGGGEAGVTKFYITPFNLVNGEIPKPSTLLATHGPSTLAIAGDSQNGTAAGGVEILYYGATGGWLKALKVQNSVTGSSGVLELMPSAGSGKVGIGSTIPQQKLDVNGRILCGDFGYGLNASSGKYYYFDNFSGNNFAGLSGENTFDLYTGGLRRVYIAPTTGVISLYNFNGGGGSFTFSGTSDSGGYTGFHYIDSVAYYIAQNSASRVLRIGSGSAWQTTGIQLNAGGTSWGTYSDERLKTDIVELENCLESLDDIRCVKYKLHDDEEDRKKRLGVIAQDLIGKYDEAVDSSRRTADDEEEYFTVQYSDLIPVLIKSLQEAKQRIEQLEGTVASLQQQLVGIAST